MNKNKIKKFLEEKPGYLKKGSKVISDILGLGSQGIEEVQKVQKDLRLEERLKDSPVTLEEATKPEKRLFIDIETSPNLVFSWGIGNKVTIRHESIVQERAIICICYKWENESKVHSLTWDNGDDKEMLKKISKVIDEASYCCAHNGDQYDLKFIRARCFFHDIPCSSKFNSIDTLKLSRKQFMLNSNKLDYISKFLGFKGKTKTDYDLWKTIVLDNNKTSLNKMVQYCKNDVVELENIFHKIEKYSPEKKYKYIKIKK